MCSLDCRLRTLETTASHRETPGWVGGARVRRGKRTKGRTLHNEANRPRAKQQLALAPDTHNFVFQSTRE